MGGFFCKATYLQLSQRKQSEKPCSNLKNKIYAVDQFIRQKASATGETQVTIPTDILAVSEDHCTGQVVDHFRGKGVSVTVDSSEAYWKDWPYDDYYVFDWSSQPK
jgi:hypothetical protein